MYRFPIADAANADLSTTQLAQRTGLPAGTLRMWESRHGFPAPATAPGRHRRYSDRDVEIVLEVGRLRRQGLSLTAAIERVRRAERSEPVSVFARLRQLRPELQPTVLSKRALLVVTHAIEDEYCARATTGALIASFQREHFYRRAQRRWIELARCADLAVALADFPVRREPVRAPAEVPVPPEQPLAREWTLVVDAPGMSACLAAWEQPSEAPLPDALRRFELLWSFEPDVVRAASGVATSLLRRLAPTLAERIPPTLSEPVAAAPPELRFASVLSHRMVAYLAAVSEPSATASR